MAPRASSIGVCAQCGHRATKAAMVAHLEACVVTHDNGAPSRPLVALRFDAVGEPRYWLVLEARADAKLRQIDAVLRQVWLECCGHMSAFRVGRRQLAMSAAPAVAFAPMGTRVDYEYDFGSTTALTGELVGNRHGSIGARPVRLLARNEPLVWPCAECPAPATTVCPYCYDGGAGLFCDAHAAAHEHASEEIYLPVVNSPRMGVCGYAG